MTAFDEKFWCLWYEKQTAKEMRHDWLPSKRPEQVVEEYLEYMQIVSVIEKPSVLEIGVGQGHQHKFYFALLGCCRYQSVDIRPDAPATIIGDSTDPGIVERLRYMEPGGYDIIFIDGNHSPKAVAWDFFTYRDMVKPGGFLALHDTHHDHYEGASGAVKMWASINGSAKYRNTWDIFHKADYTPCQQGTKIHKQCGIGVIQI